MNVPRFSYLTTFGDEPLLHKLCKKKALLRGPFFIYPAIHRTVRPPLQNSTKAKKLGGDQLSVKDLAFELNLPLKRFVSVGELTYNIILPRERRFYLIEKEKGVADCNTLKHWIFIQILIYIMDKFFYCSTLYYFTIYKCKRSFKTNATIS